MTNFEQLKNKIAKMNKQEFAEEIMRRGEKCERCVYDSYICSGEDFEWGVFKWLEMEVKDNG